MTLQIDFFGFRYDDSIPSFIIVSNKLVFHRPTGRLLDFPSLSKRMIQANYSAPIYELAANIPWSKYHLGIGLPMTKPATTATAGFPGTWNGVPPADFATLLSSGITPYPVSAWVAPDYVRLGDGTKATWDGAHWDDSITAIPSTTVTVGSPGSFDHDVPADLTALQALGGLGQTSAWPSNDFVILGDGSLAAWDGVNWFEAHPQGKYLEIFDTPYATTIPYASARWADVDAANDDPQWGENGWSSISLAPWRTYDYYECFDRSLITWNGSKWVLWAIGNDPAFDSLADLKANATYGDSGTKSPTVPWNDDWLVSLKDGQSAWWNGYEWVESIPWGYVNGVVRGSPGRFTNSGKPEAICLPPDDVATIASDVEVGNNALSAAGETAWGSEEYVVTRTHTRATWNGSTWIEMPENKAVVDLVVGWPGHFMPVDAQWPIDIPQMIANAALMASMSGSSAWTDGQWISTIDGIAIWNGTTFVEIPPVNLPTVPKDVKPYFGWIPFGVPVFTDRQALDASQLVPSDPTRWPPNTSVKLQDGSNIWWDGTAWQDGIADHPSTKATAGSPGTFDNDIPADLAALQSLGALGNGSRKWEAGYYIILGDGSDAYWNGLAWVAGTSPVNISTSATPGSPGTFDGDTPVDLNALQSLGDLGQTTAWQADEYLILLDDMLVTWDGSKWIVATPGSVFDHLHPAPPAYTIPYDAYWQDIDEANADPKWGEHGWGPREQWEITDYIRTWDGNYITWDEAQHKWVPWVLNKAPFAYSIVSLKADPTYGDNGSSRPPAPWHADWWVPLGNGYELASWSGYDWIEEVPWSYTDGVFKGSPGRFYNTSKADQRSQPPTTITTLQSDSSLGTAAMAGTPAWGVDEFVYLRDHSRVRWNGTDWEDYPFVGKATTLVKGWPGKFLPTDADFPESVEELRNDPDLGDAAMLAASFAAWSNGEFMDAHSSNAWWDGTTWQKGTAPNWPYVPMDVHPILGWVPFRVPKFTDRSALDASTLTPSDTTAWPSGTSAPLDDGSTVYWDGAAWQDGVAP